MDISNLLDENGKVKRWPKKKEEKIEVLKYLNTKFEEGKQYSEKEVNEILNKWHNFSDYALLRREMFDNYLLERTRDGRKYWIKNR
jgi:hypothetical protein